MAWRGYSWEVPSVAAGMREKAGARVISKFLRLNLSVTWGRWPGLGPKLESSCLDTEFLNMDFMPILRSPIHSLCKNGSLQKKTHISYHDLQGPSHTGPDLPPSLLSPQLPCTLCTAILSGIPFTNLLSGPCFLVRGQCSTCNRDTHPRTICIEAGDLTHLCIAWPVKRLVPYFPKQQLVSQHAHP